MSLALIRSNDAIPVDFTAVAEHDAAKLFPLMPDAKITSLAEDIRVNGQRDPIVLVRVADVLVILDGRNRALACRKLGIQPQYVVLDVADPVAFVLSSNLERRHLDESQRAMVAARLATLRHGQRADRVDASIEASTQEDAAKRLNVGRASVQRARAVLESGSEDLVDAVERGVISVSAAAKVALVPEDERSAALHEATVTPATRREAIAKRDADVTRLHKDGAGTAEIARTLGMHESSVSEIKSRLGIGANARPTKLWRDIEHVATTLGGAQSQIEKLTEQLSGAKLNATYEEIETCSKRLLAMASEVRRLATGLRSLLNRP